ncbi:MAG: DUF2878 domain-containing protein [Gammaproteobacteria bacterium]|jgi:hypothetical protein
MRLLKFITSSPVNMVINNLFWAGCVIGRYDSFWFVAPAILFYVALLIYARVVTLKQLLFPIILGIAIDSLFTVTGMFQFEPQGLLLPLWMCSLWIAFSTTLPLSLRLLGHNGYLAALTGGLGFPFSYYLGHKLGAIQFGLPLPWVITLIALTWAVLLPMMYKWINTQPVLNHEIV